DFNTLNDNVEKRLMIINEKVNERLDQNFEKTNKTFTSVIERLSKIDEAQKKIETLSGDIVSLESILTDKKSRGIFGEVNLHHILATIFGDKNDKIYRMQYTMSTGVIADSVLFAPEPLGTIAIDSKFPLENYQKMLNHKIDKEERNVYEKMFKNDVKKHIDAISSKYIIPGETSDQAILFLPAEAIFAEINAYHQDIIDYAYKKRVWITSPTTLISTLTVVEMIIKNIERDKYTQIIHEELNKLGIEFSRYKERWDKLSRSIQTVNKDVENFSITTDKLSKKFESINRVEIKELKNTDLE
ncbi:MAG: DNA recombination protein RmuC, partial [Bacilli bacterium]|nr:DNA recombination protein RmuC [Bacilli bacterium]